MAKNDAKVTDNPKLKQKKLSDGQISLYLDYYMGYTKVINEQTGKETIKADRKKEFLNLYIWDSPRTPAERQNNKETLELAKKIRDEKEQQLKEGKLGYRLKVKNVNFLDYFQAYIDKSTARKDIRMLKSALNRFKDFLKEQYPIYSNSIKPEQLNKDMMAAFVIYLQSKSIGEGASNFYRYFKHVVNHAIENDIIAKNPCAGITCKVDKQILRKDILSMDEIKQLINTTYDRQSEDIRRAFIFCLYTGIRFCDIVELQYKNVDYTNKILKFEQNKTKGHSSASGVIIPLNDGLLSLIGAPDEANNGLIFHLPSHTMCLKALKRWTKRADITKHITWHCARHSFAVNILNNGANIKTVASLLGHSGLNHTEKYTRAVDSLKEAAINSLPELNIN
jgi:site-specific recombinase XerD